MAIQDFRNFPFARPRVESCGRFLGHRTYWKLYAIENCMRVILHSILVAQIGPNWWDTSVEPATRKAIESLKQNYKKGVHTLPGSHDIYYVYLSDLTKIMTTTRNLVIKVIADVDTWIVKMEGIRIPRNLVGHMNFPNTADRSRIDTLHIEVSTLMQKLEKEPGLKIRIP
jgi:hypothetical protein